MCFVSWQRKSEGYAVTRGCYDRKFFFPPDDPIYCGDRSNLPNYGRMCCEENFCNTQTFQKIDEDDEVDVVVLLVCVVALAVIAYTFHRVIR